MSTLLLQCSHKQESLHFGHTKTGFSLGRLHMGGGQVLGDKVLMGGTREGGHRPYGGLTLIDNIIN